MDAKLVRKYVKEKKKTFLGTILLLLVLAFETYYLNCYSIYVPGFCEMSFVLVVLAIIVANVWFYFSGGGRKKNDSKRAMSGNAGNKPHICQKILLLFNIAYRRYT